ncbi:syntaxin-like protein psy1 [Grosmannia clavigera kw1407]|uniref:Syntaxin-like protein psy1 n=1 Tax=Grosmannia clavigera (strain kw1407 / UAMH 11150) TaxID=655863 RepID=F0XFM9_GROCL|nr:syntaxin-like protein psy1 [Grosmannia clavigera kw1407]EFX03451.1 syntaxin-like protein psy1 [Grosmannia clavigera kw1407]
MSYSNNTYQAQSPYETENQYSQYQGNPYEQTPGAETGNGYGQPEQHEMQPYGQPANAGAPVMTQQEYLAQVSSVRGEIRSLTTSVQSIAGLHQRALGGNEPGAAQQLEQLVAQTQLKNTQIRNQLRLLQRDCERTTDSLHALKKRQFETLNNDFKKELQSYMNEEKQYRETYREQIARQYRIVNPEATETEVAQAADADWGSEGIFQTALRTNRSGQATAVLGAVRARHNELQRIEQSITELNGLFNDLDTLVIQQDPVFSQVEDQTQNAVGNLESANKQVEKATKSARNRRKLKWFCLLVVVLIIIAIALGVGLGVALNKNNK